MVVKVVTSGGNVGANVGSQARPEIKRARYKK